MTPQEELYKTLSESATLLDFIPVDKIVSEYPTEEMFGENDVGNNFPRLTFVLADRRHALYADNTPLMDTLEFDIDLWLVNNMIVDYSLNTIKLEVDKIMLGLGYYKLREEEQPLTFGRVQNLSLSYTKEFPSNL